MERSDNVGIIFPEILIPEAKINLKKWSVIACDQFTSNEDYWARTARAVGGAPSTLHIIMPEAFLRNGEIDDRIAHAKSTMSNYIEDGVLVRLPKGVVLVERQTEFGTRVGLMIAVDLEKYDVDPSKKTLIRATEQTVADRVPPRVQLRDGAILECPHVMLLIDDLKNTVIGPLYEARSEAVQVYNTPLLMDGGSVKGWFFEDEQMLDGIVKALEKLKAKSKDGMLFAVGDGNHSLVSAKAVWEKHKARLSEEEREVSPLRYTLVEVVNLYDNGLSMLPIHRMLFNVEPSTALRMLVSILNGMGCEARMMYTRGTKTPVKPGVQVVYFESKMSKGRIEISKPQHELVSVTMTLALDRLLQEMPKGEIDYIHGDDEFHDLAKEHACLGFLMEPMVKEELFQSVIEYGVLPRKAFSLGRPEEKRYYFECRLLVEAKPQEEPEAEPEQQAEAGEPEAVEAAEKAPPQQEQAAEVYEAPAEYDVEDDDDAFEDDFLDDESPRKKRKGLFGFIRKREK